LDGGLRDRLVVLHREMQWTAGDPAPGVDLLLYQLQSTQFKLAKKEAGPESERMAGISMG
jgi:hypothetical protein